MRKRHWNLLFPVIFLTALVASGPAGATPEHTFLDVKHFDQEILAGESFEYSHIFEPDYAVTDVTDVWLGILFADLDLEKEWVVISLDSEIWKGGQASFNLIWGNVTARANIEKAGDEMSVQVEVVDGDDATLKVSAFRVDYTSSGSIQGPNPAIPEPSAAAVFAFGALLVGRAARRRART